jgi:putative photosynthetic complex assembly protein 2
MLSAFVYAVLLWWAGTGVILLLLRLDRAGQQWALGGGALVAGVALWSIAATAGDTRPSGAYLAFTAAIVLWGFAELAFLGGWVTGPRRSPCPAGAGPWRRAGLALAALLYHELLLLALGAAIVAAAWGGTNQVAAWTYGILWVMRASAKLNVFLGVRNLNAHWLPAELRWVATYFGPQRGNNPLLPLSLLLACWAAAELWWLAAEAATPTLVAAYALPASLLGLALLEHVLMVLPLSADRLWGMRSPSSTSGAPEVR